MVPTSRVRQWLTIRSQLLRIRDHCRRGRGRRWTCCRRRRRYGRSCWSSRCRGIRRRSRVGRCRRTRRGCSRRGSVCRCSRCWRCCCWRSYCWSAGRGCRRRCWATASFQRRAMPNVGQVRTSPHSAKKSNWLENVVARRAPTFTPFPLEIRATVIGPHLLRMTIDTTVRGVDFRTANRHARRRCGINVATVLISLRVETADLEIRNHGHPQP